MNKIYALQHIAAIASEERDMNDLLGEIQGICRAALQKPDVAELLGELGQYFDAMDAIVREGTVTSALIAKAECGEAEARLRALLAAHRKGGDV